MGTSSAALTSETVELLQQLIRNQCVNDGTPQGGHESRSAELLRNELDGLGVDTQLLETTPGRASLVARYEGTDRTAPAICLMGHTDVVPVSPDGWDRDPFGGELVTSAAGVDEVWGRGAVDMLNLTSSMLVAFREVVRSGTRYPGDIVFFAVADEEAGGFQGARPILADDWDAVRCDFVLTEYGGLPSHGANGTTVLMTVGEKGLAGRRVTVRGTPSHASMTFGADNALVKAAEVVRRIAHADISPRIDEMFADRVAALGLAPEIEAGLLDPGRLRDTLAELPVELARNTHSCCHTTINPTVLHSGEKGNTVPDQASMYLDIRTMPGQTQSEVDELLEEIIGEDLMPSVDIAPIVPNMPDASPFSTTETPLWDALRDSVRLAYPGARLVPSLVTGGTDARFFRARGVPAYGAGLLSDKITLPEFLDRFHGHNERIDVESLELTTQLWRNVLDRLWA